MKRRVVALAVAALIALMMFAGCGGNGTGTPTPGGDGAKEKVILITMDKMDQHWVNVDKGCQDAAAELGTIDYQWMAPDKKDDAKQIEMINNAVAANAKVILLAANGPDAVNSALTEAKDKGVLIIYVDSPANFPGLQTLATNNENAGKTAGGEMLKALQAAGINDGKIGIVNVNASTGSVVSREKGFRSAFDGTAFTLLETVYADGDAARSKDAATNFITQGCVGLFGTNEGSTVGVGNAIKESGGGVLGVGFDKSDAIMALLDEGSLLCAMAQDPYKMGFEGMKSAGKAIKGETLSPDVVDTGVQVLPGKAGAVATPPPAATTTKVILVTMDKMDQHWVNVDKGCQEAAAELGNIEYQWMAPDKKDDAKQIEMINNAVAAGANILLLAANGPDAVNSALTEAQEKGVQIIYVDSPANFPGLQTLATDNEAAGKTAGTEMLKALQAAGKTDGKIGIVNVNASTGSVVAREKGFRSAFDGTAFTLLETVYADGDAVRSKDAATNFVTQGCVGIFGTNEGSTVGTGNAIKEAGGGVIGVGFDKSDAIISLLKDGSLLCAMAQDPYKMGYEGMKSAGKVASGEGISQPNVDTGVQVLTKDNV